MSAGGHNRKVTVLEREEMIRLHVSGAVDAARSIALSLGLHRDYPAQRASERGHRPVIKPIPTQHRWVQP